MYDPADMPPAKRREEELQSEHPYLSRIHQDPKLTSDRDLRETQANYWGMITELDTSLGLLFQALKNTDQWDETLILFSSDHGEYLGDHYLTGKGQLYDGTMRVPLIVRDPSILHHQQMSYEANISMVLLNPLTTRPPSSSISVFLSPAGFKVPVS